MNPQFEISSNSINQILYFCIAKDTKIIHSHISNPNPDLQSLADRCISCAPTFHSLYFHTVGDKTFGFLFEDGVTYFLILSAAVGSAGALKLLHRIRDGFNKCTDVQNELIPVLRGLIQSLEGMSRPEVKVATESPTKVPLLRSSTSRKVSGDKVVRIDVHEETSSGTMQRSLSSRSKGTTTQKVWCRHVKLVIAADVLVCLVLFGVWMGVCKGFQCVS